MKEVLGFDCGHHRQAGQCTAASATQPRPPRGTTENESAALKSPAGNCALGRTTRSIPGKYIFFVCATIQLVSSCMWIVS